MAKGDAADRRASMALVTGTLAAILQKYVASDEKAVAIESVTVDADDKGDYRPSLTLTMASGAILRVIVVDDTP